MQKPRHNVREGIPGNDVKRASKVLKTGKTMHQQIPPDPARPIVFSTL